MMSSSSRLFLIFIIISGCHATHHTYQPIFAEPVSNPKMIFLTFSIHADSTGKSEVRLIAKKEVDGKVKGKSTPVTSSSRVKISLLDANHQVLEEEIIEHPLFREVEYTNDKKEFARKALNLKEAEFFVRMKLALKAEVVVVSEVINDKEVNSVEFNIK